MVWNFTFLFLCEWVINFVFVMCWQGERFVFLIPSNPLAMSLGARYFSYFLFIGMCYDSLLVGHISYFLHFFIVNNFYWSVAFVLENACHSVFTAFFHVVTFDEMISWNRI